LLDGRFEITRLVARGGMGKIYEALQQPLGRRVALKVMDLGFAEDLDPDFQKRFFLEASTCAKLSHPNTIRVFDYGSSGDESDTYFIAMEFIEGHTLLRLIEEEAPLAPLRVIHIARQICASLREAHEQGVIHRDLKPSNVLLTRHGDQSDFVKVLDFGLVKLMQDDAEEMTKSGLFLGSPNYMSPEQIRADHIDQRADIYSLGVLLYMGLTATSPFKRESSVKVLLAQLEDPPEPFSEVVPAGTVPSSLEWVVMTCLQKDPARRFATVSELSKALQACGSELRGQTAALELSLEDGLIVLPEEAIAAIDPSPLPSSVTQGELGIARSHSTRTDEVKSAVSRAIDLRDDARPTEPSMPARRRLSRPHRRKKKRQRRLAYAVAGTVLFLGLFALAYALSSNNSPSLGTSDITIEDMPASEGEAEQNDPPVAIETESTVSSPPARAEDRVEPVPKSSTKPARRKTKARRGAARSSTTRKSPSAPARSDSSVAKETPAPATESQSEVGSASGDEQEKGRREGPDSEESSSNKKKGDLRDPWGD